MTLEEAIRLMEVDPQLSAEELRKHYLRGLRRHKPEVDPEGFRRYREAYELLRARKSYDAVLPEEFVNAFLSVPSAPPATNSGPAPAPAPSEPEVNTSPLSAQARWASLNSVASSGQWPLAAQRLLEILGEKTTMVELPLASVFEMVVLIQANCEGSQACEVGRLFIEWVESTKSELALSPPRWLLARELLELEPQFPTLARQKMALAIISGDFKTHYERLCEFSKASPDIAAKAAQQLAVESRLLHTNFASALSVGTRGHDWESLEADRPATPRPSMLHSGLQRAWLLPLVLIGVKLLAATGSCTSTQPHSSAVWPPTYQVDAVGTEPARWAAPATGSTHEALQKICSLTTPSICTQAQRFEVDLTAGRCVAKQANDLQHAVEPVLAGLSQRARLELSDAILQIQLERGFCVQ